jgi:hypothetical protein
MRQRDFMAGIAGAAAMWPPAAGAPQDNHPRRVDVILVDLTEDDPRGEGRE